MVDPNVITDADLANLTYEQLAALINEGHPEDFYNEAMAFDGATGRLRQLLDDWARESKLLEECVSGEILEAVERVATRYSAWIDSVLEPTLHPGYAQALRHAGDALATGQQRLRDLQQQNAEQDPTVPPPPEQGEQTRQQALQILRDIGTAYRDIGGMFTPLPETTAKNNNPITNNGPGTNGPANGDGQQYVGGRFRQDATFFRSRNPGGQPFVTQAATDGEFRLGGGPAPSVLAATTLGRPAVGDSSNPQVLAESQLLQETSEESAQLAPGPGIGVLGAGVLGRPTTKTVRTSRRRAEDPESTEESTEDEVLAALNDDERPETVSTTHDLAPAEQTVAVQTVAAAAAAPAIPAEKPAVAVHAALAAPSFDLSSGVTGPLDPAARGAHMPTSTGLHEVTTELAAVKEPTAPMTTDTQAVTPGTPTGAHGMPMMPMGMGGGMGMGMGGMRGGGGQDRERFADVPVTPEAEVWDPSRATGPVLGRRDPDPEPPEPSDPCPEQDDVEAAKAAAMAAILGRSEEKRS